MCGIVYVHRKNGKPARKLVLERFQHQKHRGTEGFGYVAVHNNQVVSYKRAQFLHEIEELLAKETAEEILFHHRFPTSGPNIVEMAHPLLVKNEKLGHEYYIAHNGVISNTGALYTKHIARGMEYATELQQHVSTKDNKHYHLTGRNVWNDSESLAIETALTIEGEKPTIEAIGAAAVVGLQVKDGMVTSRFYYRNYSNPLAFLESDKTITICSLGAGETVPANYVKFIGETPEGAGGILVPSSYVPTTYTGSAYTSAHRADDFLPKDSATSSNPTTRSVLMKMTTVALWEEYHKADEAITRHNDSATFYKSKKDEPTSGGWDTLLVMAERRVVSAKEYKDLVEDELLTREALPLLPAA